LSKLPVSSAQPKSRRADKPKEKLRTSAGESQQPKTHDGLTHGAHQDQSHRTAHRSNLPRDGLKVGIYKDVLRDGGPKEIPREVVREHDREAFSGGVHRDGVARHSAVAHRSGSSKHAEESRSKPIPAPATTQHRLSSDSLPLSGLAGAGGTRLTAEAKLSTKLPVCR